MVGVDDLDVDGVVIVDVDDGGGVICYGVVDVVGYDGLDLFPSVD